MESSLTLIEFKTNRVQYCLDFYVIKFIKCFFELIKS